MKDANASIDIDLAAIAACGDQAERTGQPVYFKDWQRPGWSAKLPLYVVWCRDCDDHTVTHPAGYKGRLHCKLCQKSLAVLNPKGDNGASDVH